MGPGVHPPTLPQHPIVLRVRVPREGQWSLAKLVAAGTGLPREEARAVVDHGSCQVGGTPRRDPDGLLAPGQLLVVRFVPVAPGPAPRILYQDDLVLVVDKPAGIPVQPTPQGAGNALTEQLVRLGIKGPIHVVHRLDQPVSGLLVLGRSKRAATRLTEAFSNKSIRKHYLAVSEVTPTGASWLTDTPSPHSITDPLLWVSHLQRTLVCPEGKPSRTEVVWRHLPWLLLRLHTGRSHQIRAHLSHVGLPLMGDHRYGGSTPGKRIALHSFSLDFPHPESGDLCHFKVSPPADFLELSGLTFDEELNGELVRIVG